jgi:hypothetical protein
MLSFFFLGVLGHFSADCPESTKMAYEGGQ